MAVHRFRARLGISSSIQQDLSVPSEADSNPYAVHSPIQGRLQPSPAEPVQQLVGITRAGLEPSDSLAVERKLRSYSGSHWILPITLFVVFFFVVATIPVNPLIRACLWGWSLPFLYWLGWPFTLPFE